MPKQFIILFLCCFCGFGVSNPIWMSFWDYVPSEFAGWTNFAFTDSFTDMQEGSKYGIKHLYTAESLFFDRGSRVFKNKTITPLVLRKDYLTRWQQLSKVFSEYLSNGTMFGFFLGDELVWNGLQPAMLETATKLIRHTFPNATQYTNEATDPMKNGKDIFGVHHNYTKVSPYLDWFSIDMYHFGPGTFAPDVRKFYQQYVYPKLAQQQRACLVPGSYASHYNSKCDVACYDKFCAKDATDFYSWAKEDPKVVAIAPWHWKLCAGCDRFRDEIGTRNLTQTKKAWHTIGEEIIKQAVVAPRTMG